MCEKCLHCSISIGDGAFWYEHGARFYGFVLVLECNVVATFTSTMNELTRTCLDPLGTGSE